jgi:hypothetical protein
MTSSIRSVGSTSKGTCLPLWVLTKIRIPPRRRRTKCCCEGLDKDFYMLEIWGYFTRKLCEWNDFEKWVSINYQIILVWNSLIYL